MIDLDGLIGDAAFEALDGIAGPDGGGAPFMVYGGLTAQDARTLYQDSLTAKYARKNLWIIGVNSYLAGDFSKTFNLFATDVSRSPSEVSGGKIRAGGAVLDTLTQAEPVVLRITTLDDEHGTLKQWFEQHCAAVCRPDGTFGVPGGSNGYAILFQIQHAFATQTGGFTGKILCRALSYEVELSRRDDALEELIMQFTQLDTFMSV